jgi:hypothetical protein
MKTPHLPEPAPAFPQMVSVALRQLKQRLHQDYQKAYPDSGEIIHLVLDQEEAKAREISFFPHLILPDLVETKIAELESSGLKTHHGTLGA